MVRACACPTAPVPQAPAQAQNIDVAQLAQQLADMQCQFARLQSSSGAGNDQAHQLGTATEAATQLYSYGVNPAQAGLAQAASNVDGYASYPAMAAVPLAVRAPGMHPALVPGPPPAPPAVVPGLVGIENLGDLQCYSNTDGQSDRSLKSALRGWYIDLQELLPVVTYYGVEATDLTPTIDLVSGVVSYKYRKPQ